MKVDITNRKELNALLDQLRDDTPAIWGIMKPQNMVEHLSKTLQASNGKIQLEQRVSEEETRAAKEAFIYTDMAMPKGVKTPLLGDTPAPFERESLAAAIKELNGQLDDFEAYYAGNPTATFIHPRLGLLNYQEWIIFHNKHFTHHFTQFGLV